MTQEDQQFLKALVDRRILTRELLTVRSAALETIAREKGIARALGAVFNIPENIIADSLAEVFNFARMPIANEIETAPGTDTHRRRDYSISRSSRYSSLAWNSRWPSSTPRPNRSSCTCSG